jgi:hypothetical protein
LLEISEQTYYRWRQKYGGMQPEMICWSRCQARASPVRKCQRALLIEVEAS